MVAFLADHYRYRNTVVRSVLAGAFPVRRAVSLSGHAYLHFHHPVSSHRSATWKTHLLIPAGATVALAAGTLSGSLWWQWRHGEDVSSLPTDGTTALAVASTLLLVVAGAAAAYLWRGLINPALPSFSSSAVRSVFTSDLAPLMPPEPSRSPTATNANSPRAAWRWGAWLLAAVLVWRRHGRRR